MAAVVMADALRAAGHVEPLFDGLARPARTGAEPRGLRQRRGGLNGWVLGVLFDLLGGDLGEAVRLGRGFVGVQAEQSAELGVVPANQLRHRAVTRSSADDAGDRAWPRPGVVAVAAAGVDLGRDAIAVAGVELLSWLDDLASGAAPIVS